MATPSKTRLKTKAQADVPQTKDAAAADVRRIGDLQRQITRTQAEMNDAIAHITSTYQPVLETIGEQLKPLQEGVQAYCEAHRNELTNDGKVKTANLVTGEVQWRQRPPQCRCARCGFCDRSAQGIRPEPFCPHQGRDQQGSHPQ